MSHSIDFDAENPIPFREVPFRFGGEDYVVVEATGETVCKYQNAVFRSSRMEDGKVVGMEGLADSVLVLVSGCILKVKDGIRSAVALSTVKDWPHRVVDKLFTVAKDLSGIDRPEKAEDVEKQIEALQKRLVKLKAGTSPEEEASGKRQGDGQGG